MEHETLSSCCSMELIHDFPNGHASGEELKEMVDDIDGCEGDHASIILLAADQQGAQEAAKEAGFVAVATYPGSEGPTMTVFLKGVKLAPRKRKVARRRR